MHFQFLMIILRFNQAPGKETTAGSKLIPDAGYPRSSIFITIEIQKPGFVRILVW